MDFDTDFDTIFSGFWEEIADSQGEIFDFDPELQDDATKGTNFDSWLNSDLDC